MSKQIFYCFWLITELVWLENVFWMLSNFWKFFGGLLLLLLLLSHFSRVWLCATPSLGFSRQEHWSGLPFPSPMHKSEKWKWSRSVMSDSYQAPPSMGFSRQEYWSGVPLPSMAPNTVLGKFCLLENNIYSLVFWMQCFINLSYIWLVECV